MLSGLINTVLFIATRRVLPPIKLRRKSVSGTSGGHPGISISVHATRTQQISSATGEPSYLITLPPPKFTHIGGQAYELEECSHLPTVPEKAEPRWRKAVANARAVGICPRGLAFAEEESWVIEHTFRRSRRIVTSLKNQFWGFCGIHRMS